MNNRNRISHFPSCLYCLSVILFLFLALGTSAPLAAKPDCAADPTHPSCKPDGGDGGGGGTLTLVPITAEWTGAATESAARSCADPQGAVVSGYVHYGCSYPGAVEVSLIGGTEGGSDGAELCPELASLTLGGDNPDPIRASRITTYFLSHDPTWNDGPCLDGAECQVLAKITAYFDEWCENGKCGRLVLFEGWGNVVPAADGDLNPFTDAQYMELDHLDVSFKGIGKNRTVATCSFMNPGITVETTPSG